MISLPELFLLHTLINDLHINMAVLILVAIKTSPNITRGSNQRRWAEGHVVHKGKMTNEYKILVETVEGKRPHARPRYRREDCIVWGSELDSRVSG
jgi:hypothetical protein